MDDNLNFLKMEADLNFFEKRRQPKFFLTEDDYDNILNGKQTQFIFQMEDYLNLFFNGIRP